MGEIIFFDTEVTLDSKQIKDFGAIADHGGQIHTGSSREFLGFIKGASFLCGHNVIRHDIQYLNRIAPDIARVPLIDTLSLSPLLFPKKPYHHLVKDDKLYTEQLNNPLNDSIQAKDLFYDCLNAYNQLDVWLKRVYKGLLYEEMEFASFFKYIDNQEKKEFRESSNILTDGTEAEIRIHLDKQICSNANLKQLILENPIELAYAIAIIHADDQSSITPRWVLFSYSEVEGVLNKLRNTPCLTGCVYCDKALNPISGLQDYFGYEAYREFDGVPLQERAVEAALYGKSLLAVFPTGGGKSITFQIPALMAGRATRGLTVVISPLQSLMKDQVDNLEKMGITEAVTINGLLDPIERAKAIQRVEDGSAKILYLSPESLRSKSMERLMLGRKIERFVIDEAHCFSAWGQDFRVDYLYIAEFIRNIYEKKQLEEMIPVSCFTATAKQNVVDDIREYFRLNLELDLELYTASAARKNLKYKIIKCSELEKYERLRILISTHECPTIVYTSSTKKTEELAERLNSDGYRARAYHGKMDKKVKSKNQDQFTSGEIDIMVATSAFGMGVDKSDVGLVIHYQISNSLESYVQEAGRAGRDQSINAECLVLYNDEDLNSHFNLLNQTKLNISEIGNVWRGIKEITRFRKNVSKSALEIARKAGWDDSVYDIETRVKTAIAALEQAGYLKRGQNNPRVYADSILSESVLEASERIRSSQCFDERDAELAIRIIAKLIAARSRKNSQDELGEMRIDYIGDQLGIKKADVIHIVGLLKEERILADKKDLAVFLKDDMTRQKALNSFKWHRELEEFLYDELDGDGTVNIKELNEKAEAKDLKKVTPDKIITILNFLSINHVLKKESSRQSKNHFRIYFLEDRDSMMKSFEKRIFLADFILTYLYNKNDEYLEDEGIVEFSVLELKEEFMNEHRMLQTKVTQKEIEDALFYLSRIEALKIEGGFLVIYNALSIERLEEDNRIQYKIEDYKKLQTYYEQKAHQIHIVGEYANKLLENYEAALKFVDDYFTLNYQTFLAKYFKGAKGNEIRRNVTPAKFRQLFGELSTSQLDIVKDQNTKYIVVAAGPGSGKTRILVHKLASLLLMEDVKHEQLLMVTFSRSAAVEFKRRLKKLIGSSANYVDIKTFHSFCFDILGRVGDIEKSSNIVNETAHLIKTGEIEQSRITKTVMVIDEAQDMDEHEFELVRGMTKQNPNMRVIAVGDDDQNIYEFRGSKSKYLKKISEANGAKTYELVDNYRSKSNLVEFSNQYVQNIKKRMKSTPIHGIDSSDGEIELIRYHHDNMLDGVINRLVSDGAKGSVCILTATNDEALQIAGRLMDVNIKAKLIQTSEQVKPKDLDEVRYFIQCLKLSDECHTIDDYRWGNAKHKVLKKYSRSEYIGLCKRLFSDFEVIAGKQKYVSDFNIFLRESKLDDFIYSENDVIQVSTMHKAKGREFDSIIIMLDKFKDTTDSNKRLLYVAMTRAKEALMIHYRDMGLHQKFSQIYSMDLSAVAEKPGMYAVEEHKEPARLQLSEVKSSYRSQSNISFQLGYQDIFLSLFIEEEFKERIADLQSGDELAVDLRGCCDKNGKQILAFSKSFKERLNQYRDKGYVLHDAKVHMVVFWKSEDMDEEVRIVMPIIRMKECQTDYK